MLSRSNPLLTSVRKRLFSSPQLRCQLTTFTRITNQRVQNQRKKCVNKRRNLSSDKDAEDVRLEDCARSLTQALGNPQAAEMSLEPAMEFAQRLSPEARREIMRVASASSSETSAAAAVQEIEVPEPSWHDLRLVALAQAIPFLGFGFMDNAILIIAGDAIDTSLGVVLGISTMCAAAIGNIISDVAGILLGTVIEDFCTNYLRLPMPNLTNAQRKLRSVRIASQTGCGIGIVIGCIIGMFPLLFIDHKKIQAMKREAALQSLFENVMSEAKDLVGAESASLFIVVENDPETNESPRLNPEGQYLHAKYFRSDSGEVSHRTFKMGRGIVSRAALTGQAWNIHDVNSEPDFSQELTGQQHKIRNMACVPVLDAQGKTIAVIRAFNKISEGSIERKGERPVDPTELKRRGFTNNDMQILKALASHISVTLQYMYQEADDAAAIDAKDTIQLLKEHGLAGIPEERPTGLHRRTALFPEN